MTKRRSGTTVTGPCRFPGCDRRRQPTTAHGHTAYCDLPEHNHDTAYRARKKAAALAERQELQRELQRLREIVKSAGLPIDAPRSQQVA